VNCETIFVEPTTVHVHCQRLVLVLLIGLLLCPVVDAQDPEPAPASPQPGAEPAEKPLMFSFDGASWRDVIRWLAAETDSALHVGELPTGTFTYSDPNGFSPDEAIARVNLFLLPQGFTIVRSGKMLSVINLSDPRSGQQLDALAKLVSVAQLEKINDHDVVKCIFLLGELKAEEAVEELSPLNLMTKPIVFSKTNRLMITDTSAKLRSVQSILDAFEPRTLNNGTVVKNFALQHVDAEDILVVARPHLGLATGEMIGIDVSISADLKGKNIYVTGVEDKVKVIEGLVAALDKAAASLTAGEAELRSHVIKGGNVEIVYNVLLTLLAEKDVRLSMDEMAGTIVALAPKDVQAEIEQTVAQLQAADAEFEVIPLKTVDPYFAISLLEEMLDLPDIFTDPEDIDPDAPKIDADPGARRLFVRGKRHHIDQIKEIVSGLDATSAVGGKEQVRLLPLRGERGMRTLETAAKFWRGPNPIIFYQSAVDEEPVHTERVVHAQPPGSKLTVTPARQPAATSGRILSKTFGADAPAIRCQFTARGLLLQSDDTGALDRFEQHLGAIAGPLEAIPSPPVSFYLKYTKPHDALRLLAELLDGGDSAREGEAGSLVNGFVESGSRVLFGSLVTSRDGTTTLTAGSITVVADSRLNRLIAQGTAADIEKIENYLKILDKDTSITTVETYGASHLIELKNTKASEVATAIRDAYAGRVYGGSGAASQAGGQSRGSSGRQPGQSRTSQPQSESRDRNDDREQSKGESNSKADRSGEPRKSEPKRASSAQSAQNLEPRMTIAVHEPSNSLIVTAPDQLFQEVERLALLIDSRNERSLQVIAVTNPALEQMLQQVINGGVTSGRPARTAPTRPTSSPTRQPSGSRSSSPELFKSGR
jgi:type II secretory pathway component GspD/PulD (secretin)